MGAIRSESHQVNDFINTATPFFPDRGGRPGRAPGVSESEPPEYRNKRMRPGRALGAPATPAAVRIIVSLLPGVRFAHPRLISLRPVGAGNVTVVRQEPNVTPASN